MIRRPLPPVPQPRNSREAIRILEALLTDGLQMMLDLGAFRNYRPPPLPRAIGFHPRRRLTRSPRWKAGRKRSAR